ncbi:MAG TPA: hypothetical protein DCM86_10975 [Verrucomicrobiales bacterium]|nr:hypothetical protein [Verrucomicrobiales bacterium]
MIMNQFATRSRVLLGASLGVAWLLWAALPLPAAERGVSPSDATALRRAVNTGPRVQLPDPPQQPAPAPAEPRATAAPAPAKPAAASKAYTLSPGDRIELKIFQHPDMASSERISEEGELTLPLIGRVHLGGLTEEQAKRLVHELYEKDYFVNPQISLSVADKGKWRFTVSGQVARAGTYEANNGESLDLIEAITRAGDFTGKGRKTDVQIIRRDLPPIYRNVEEMMRGKEPPFEIKPGDQIFVRERII